MNLLNELSQSVVFALCTALALYLERFGFVSGGVCEATSQKEMGDEMKGGREAARARSRSIDRSEKKQSLFITRTDQATCRSASKCGIAFRILR